MLLVLCWQAHGDAESEKHTIAELDAFVEEAGFEVSGLRINTDAPLRGIYTEREFKQGDVLFSMDLESEFLITPATMYANNPPFQFLDELPEVNTVLNGHLKAALWLLQQSFLGEESKFYRYIQSQPSNFTVPMVQCHASDLEPVSHFEEGARILRVVDYHNAVLDRAWKFLSEHFFPHFQRTYPSDRMTYEALRWAWYCIKTRTWHDLQVPWVDMFNHAPRAALPSRSDNVFSAKAEKDYGVGEEVFISYGPKSNEGLWETYGFLLDENPYNCVEFSVNLDNAQNPLYRAFLKPLVQSLKGTPACVTAEGLGLRRLLHVIRLATIDEKELTSFAETLHKIQPFSWKTEHTALRLVLSELFQLSKKFSESVEEEGALKTKHATNDCVQTVLRLRDERRQVTKSVIDFVLKKWNGALATGSIGEYPQDVQYEHQHYM